MKSRETKGTYKIDCFVVSDNTISKKYYYKYSNIKDVKNISEYNTIGEVKLEYGKQDHIEYDYSSAKEDSYQGYIYF